MTSSRPRRLEPFTLAVAAALALTACGSSRSSATEPASRSSAQASTTAAMPAATFPVGRYKRDITDQAGPVNGVWIHEFFPSGRVIALAQHLPPIRLRYAVHGHSITFTDQLGCAPATYTWTYSSGKLSFHAPRGGDVCQHGGRQSILTDGPWTRVG